MNQNSGFPIGEAAVFSIAIEIREAKGCVPAGLGFPFEPVAALGAGDINIPFAFWYA